MAGPLRSILRVAARGDDREGRVRPAHHGGRAAQAARRRRHRRLRSVDDVLTPKDTLHARLLGAHREPEEAVRDGGRARLLVRHPEPGALPRQLFKQRGCVSMVIRQIPFNDPDASRSWACRRSSRKLAERPRGLVLVTGPTGSGKSHHARGDDRQDQQGAEGPHHHGRRPDRVHPPPPELHRQPARGRHRHQELRRPRSSTRCARTPTSSWSAKCATWRRSRPALTIAETGHLAFATLHTNSAAESINRIIDVFPSHQQSQVRAQLAFVLEGVDHADAAAARRTGRGRVDGGRDPGRARRPSARSSATTRSTRSTRSCRPARSTACRR